MKGLMRNKRAITPVLSSLLLTVVAVAAMSLAATAAYVISDNLHQTMGERFIVEDVWFKSGKICIYLHNVGKVAISLTDVYVNRTSQTIIPFTLEINQHRWLNITYSWVPNSLYHIHVSTSRGTIVEDYYVAQ
jgi:hypothetical protein